MRTVHDIGPKGDVTISDASREDANGHAEPSPRPSNFGVMDNVTKSPCDGAVHRLQLLRQVSCLACSLIAMPSQSNLPCSGLRHLSACPLIRSLKANISGRQATLRQL